MSTQKTRLLSQVNPGNRGRMRMAMSKYAALQPGEKLNIAFLGGSITAGQGAVDGQPFPYWAMDILHTVFDKDKLSVHNGAVPGTLSSYMSVCHNVHLPKDADIIFLDYSVNDDYTAVPPMDNKVRRPFERLLRTLLNYPRQPAVVMIHAFAWHRVAGPSGLYWPSSERDFHEFAMYYGIPEISVKASAWRLMHASAKGFNVTRTRADHAGRFQHEIDAELKGDVFYWDVIHPDGSSGHRFMGELVAQYVLDAYADVSASPVTLEDMHARDDALPPPMLPMNYQAASDKCFIGPVFKSICVEPVEGWTWKDEGKDPARPKLGYVTDMAGAVLCVKIDTHTHTHRYVTDTAGAVLRVKIDTMTGGNSTEAVTLEVTYLRSYVNMGRARIECESGCACLPTEVDGHHTDKTSQLYLHEWMATQHKECIVKISVLPETSGPPGHHKFKIAGIMISEGGDRVFNWGAVQMTLEGLKANGAFDIKQWQSGRRSLAELVATGTAPSSALAGSSSSSSSNDERRQIAHR
ncbi:hypothetical protein FOA52_005966 [Chlamydomonas sp. UWO 241]|nr:hypothetical protein FOA52_005966 [Chlamydomonas sp. UWO 241]